ncbi:hypothetical protein Micbo1qcDRAFT_224011 [Microdochium bolleyi]|uniref:Uncharacterized protein n=1 Tax=Microdochium bolleyi TaxID=196109 RepID=A0A136J3T6_9PEZI|nr:hypothetical protein Micbo1qcDRAFT_224011 [Microdochium bolleyi]
MGGSIFSKGSKPLYTPRMPPQVYEHVRNHCHARLRGLFVAVATPLEGPAKPDFGDVDISLAWPRAELFPTRAALQTRARFPGSLLEAAAAAVGAVRTQGVNGSSSEIHAAVAWPEEYAPLIPPLSTVAEEGMSAAATTAEKLPPARQAEAYIQVDLHIFPDIQTLQWQLFKHAHGDLWGILGSTIRPYGLTADEVGLYLRIPEIEKLDHKRAKVFLTSEPGEVLSFLGMKGGGCYEDAPKSPRDEGDAEEDVWATRFTEKKDFFDSSKATPAAIGDPTSIDETARDASEYTEESTKSLRSRERRRMKHRPLFAEFMSEYFPDHHHHHSLLYDDVRAESSSVTSGQQDEATAYTRDSVREDAFVQFGPLVRYTYEQRLREWTAERQRVSIRKSIKAIVPAPYTAAASGSPSPADQQQQLEKAGAGCEDCEERLDPSFRGQVVSALTKIILEEDYSLGISPGDALRDQANGLFDEEKVKGFVTNSWRDVACVLKGKNTIAAHQRTSVNVD